MSLSRSTGPYFGALVGTDFKNRG